MSEKLRVDLERKAGVNILRLVGAALDVSTAPEFKTDCAMIVQENPRIVLNLQKLDFLDSSGVGALLSLLRHAKTGGGDVRICCVPENIRALFELVRINRLFDVFEAEDDAVRSF